MDIDRAAVAVKRPAPDALQNEVARQGNATMASQKEEQFELL